MPRYKYYCPANDETVELSHSMTFKLKTWGEVCEMASIKNRELPADTPVERLIGAGFIITGKSSGHQCSGGCGGNCGNCSGNCNCH